MRRPFLLAVLFLLAGSLTHAAEPPDTFSVGVAAVDVTPDYNVRLSGFGFRRAESEGVTQKVWAKALAIDDGEPAVIVTVDNLGIPASMRQEIAARLEKKAKLKPGRLAITASHTHTAPMLTSVAPTLFGEPIPKEHQERIDRYTRELTDNLEKAALAALEDRKPAQLSWGVGTVGFAINRRTQGGPVDHDLPMLVVRDLKGNVRGVYVTYACHCVTLSNNKLSGDWAGYAQEHIQDAFPNAVALASVGCGADSNPNSGVTGDKAEIASRQGLEIANEVKRLIKGPLTPVTGKLSVASKQLELPLADLPERAVWEEKAKRKDAVGHHARVHLERLDRGEKPRTKIDYLVQTWAFGDALAMVFLPGEVVVDYSLRLKRELDGLRLWVNAYGNDAPCYIPSERVLKEGGYEGGGAMVYYDLPGPLKAGLEQKIIDAVKEQVGDRFKASFDGDRTGGSRPMSPQQSLGAMKTKKDLSVELVVAEPLVSSPVAVDWGPDGRLYVAEMYDYPSGTKGDFKPGGRVKVLRDADGDGRYDSATVFLDNIPFPTGVTVWRKGVLVCAAPDILYAEDTDGDGKADVVKKLFSGFGTDNYQGRVNSLEYGLDGWVYGSCGLFGGKIKSDKGEVNLGDRDFRIKPDVGVLEPATGRTQQGRVRDDWGDWFGCDNSTLCRHYPLLDHYLRRNPHAAPPATAVLVPDSPDPNRLYPLRQQLQLFKLSGAAGRTTAACGLGMYRDDLLGSQYTGNTFTCEPVSLVVHRLSLSPKGSTFSGRRADDEKESEFLASTDNWFRPVQIRTGPDGCLWVVDMYRFVIEHPRWIPPEDLAKLDVRAGSNLGRIYRIRPKDKEPRSPARLDKLDTPGLVAALDTANGWQRDLASQMLLWKGDADAVKPLRDLLTAKRPEARLHAQCVLDGLGKLDPSDLFSAVKDEHPGVRRHAVRLAEPHLGKADELSAAVANLSQDADPQVRLQVACSLGAWKNPWAARALASLALKHSDDPYLVGAVLSSLTAENVGEVLTAVFQNSTDKGPPDALTQRLIGVAAALGDQSALPKVLKEVVTPRDGKLAGWQLAALAGLFDALDRKGQSLDKLVDGPTAEQVGKTLTLVRQLVAAEKTPEGERLAAMTLLGRDRSQRDADLDLLGDLLTPQRAAAVQSAAATALGRIADDRAASVLVAGWKGYSPALKSQVLDLLLGRPAWQEQLLAGIEMKDIPAGQIDPTRRQRLLTHKDEAVRTRAAKLFDGAASPDRQKVIDGYKETLTLKGDATRGQVVFSKSCSVCHRLGDVGHVVGPDLAALANKSPAFLLVEVLDPNRNVDSRWLEYRATTKAGRLVSGVLVSESATSVTLRAQEGKEQVLLRADLDDLASSGKSLMPEGLEKDLKPQDLADLFAYLGGMSTPAKTFPGNKPEVIKPADGKLALLATTAEIRGGEIAFEADFKNVGFWHGAEDTATWTVDLDKGGEFDVWLDWACDNGSANNPWVLESSKPLLRGKVAGTGGWDKYRQEKVGSLTLEAGRQRVTLRPDGVKPNGALMDLRGIHLVPKGQKPDFGVNQTPAPTDAPSLAKLLLDDSQPAEKRQAAINDHPKLAAVLVTAMTADLKQDSKEEYRRIPWIWRVAIAAGKRNDAEQIRGLLEVSLPKSGEPLRDWQAVVIGGGLINGVSLQGIWPRPRFDEVLKGHAGLAERWQKTLSLAAAMADNEKVPTGTRYDALRMIAVDSWERQQERLASYLKKGTHDELQMGAVSALSDVDETKVAALLLSGMEHYSAGNRKLALDALLRTEGRTAALLDAMEKGQVKVATLGEGHVKALRTLKDDALRARALKLLPP